MKLYILVLAALPMCLAQFSIQGPSDGHRRAQGLKFSQEKGVEYTDQSESLGAGDFTIQGATDGHSNFQIQGASDGHSDFDIQGASDAGVNFHIQGATDGHSQSIIQGPYDENHAPHLHSPAPVPAPVRAPAPAPVYQHQQPVAYSSGNSKSLSYNDPATGLRVNWKSYDRQPRPQPQPQQEQQYVASAAPSRGVAPQRQSHPQPQPAPEQNYRVFNTIPPYIKQLLQFQSQIPYVNTIPEQVRYQPVAAPQGQPEHQAQPQYQQDSGSKQSYRSKPQAPSRHRRQAPQQHQQQRQRQPPAQPQPHYSTNLPTNLQALLKYQAQIPYVNVIPEQYRYDVDAAVQSQAEQVRAHYQKLAREQGHNAPQVQSSHQRQRREAQHPQGRQPQYQRAQQPASQQVQYSGNVPAQIQQLLKYQAQIPYNIIANQIVYRLDKPYVPQPVQQQQSQLPQAQYQGSGGAYEAHQRQYAESQLVGQYGQTPGGIRPVTEKQY